MLGYSPQVLASRKLRARGFPTIPAASAHHPMRMSWKGNRVGDHALVVCTPPASLHRNGTPATAGVSSFRGEANLGGSDGGTTRGTKRASDRHLATTVAAPAQLDRRAHADDCVRHAPAIRPCRPTATVGRLDRSCCR